MKKSIILIGILMLMLASCSNENILLNEEVKNNVEPALTIIASQGGADSRLAFVDEKNLEWTPGDAIIVTEAASPTNYVVLKLKETEQTAVGTFSTTNETTEAELTQIREWKTNNTSLVAYYKNDGLIDNSYNDELIFLRFYDAGHESLNVYGGQTSNNNNDHLTAFNHMASKESFTLSEETSVLNLKFSQSGAIMKFTLTGLGDKTITKLSLNAAESIFLAGYHNSQSMMASSVSLPLGESGNGIALGSDETLTAYMIMGPTEATADKTITLTATALDESTYTATVTGGVIEVGKFYSVSKTMTPVYDRDYEVSDNTYIVYNAAGLEAWRTAVENDLSLNLTLANNIVLTGENNWIPIGTPNAEMPDHSDHFPPYFPDEEETETPNTEYIGTIDGNGYAITGLNIGRQENEYAGFIGALGSNGVVKNLTFADAHVNSIGYVAVVAATNKGQVKNCHVTSGDVCGEEAQIGYTFYASAAAGIVADNKGEVLGCSNGASVTCNSYLGTSGIVGRNNSVVIGCINSGTITNIGTTNSPCCGGIVGVHIGNNAISVACGNYGEVSSTKKNQTGGIAGFLNDSAKLIGLWTKATTVDDSKGDMDQESDGIGDMLNGSATACYYFNDLNSVTKAAITEMNNAIDAYNANDQNTVKCNYKWVAVNGGWPLWL